MAPEQARGEALDHRADLFSLGSVLYALCTGRPPFAAPTTLAVIRRVCDDLALPVRAVNAKIPQFMADVIDKLHAKDPKERFQSAEEVARLLRQYLRHLQEPKKVAAPPSPPPPRRPIAKSRPGRRLGLVLGLIVVAVVVGLVGAGGALLAFGSKNANATPQFDEHMVQLTNGRIGRTGGLSTLRVDYRFAAGDVPPGEKYFWVVQSPNGWILAKEYAAAELQSSDTLTATQFIMAPVLMRGDLTTYLAVEKGGRRKRISNIAPLR
jgi:hypothetical protein